ncbi:MAG: HypC/HybG/HupF family hydrogenase formation chaperone [Phycisphaeraceae bacterium]
MCLAVPAKLVQADRNHNGLADLHGNQVPVSTSLVPEACVGDWVLVHAGFAIQRLDAAEAEKTWAVLQDLQKALELSDDESS